jgi:hypothetical protein
MAEKVGRSSSDFRHFAGGASRRMLRLGNGRSPSEGGTVTTGYQRSHRLAVVEAATALAREAIGAAGASPVRSPSWHFYRGVEDAACQWHVLRPEMAMVRQGTSWLDAEDRWFRDGFLEAQLLLATAASSAEPPMHPPLPQRTRRAGSAESPTAATAAEDPGRRLPRVTRERCQMGPTRERSEPELGHRQRSGGRWEVAAALRWRGPAPTKGRADRSRLSGERTIPRCRYCPGAKQVQDPWQRSVLAPRALSELS